MAEKLLIIDDEELLRMTLRLYFEDLGFTLFEAVNGRDGLEVFRNEHPDLIFTDLRMPEMDGLTFIHELRKIDDKVPVIVISGAGTLKDAIEAVRQGAWDYVTKPITSMEELDLTARRALERARLLAENQSYREHLEDMVRQRTQELRDSEARFRTLFEAAGDAIVLLQGERIVTINRKGLELFGCTPDEIFDRTLFSFSPLTQPDGRFSSDVLRQVLERAAQGESQAYEWRHNRYDGTVFDAEISLNRLTLHDTPYLQAIIRDVTLRKQSEAQIRKLSSAVEQSANAVVITNLNGTIEYVNPKFYELTGYSPEEVIGQNPRILKSGVQDAEFYREMWSTLTAGRVWRGEMRNRRKDGELYWVRSSIAPIRDQQGKFSHYLAVKEDITEYKHYEERLYRQANFDTLTNLPNRNLLGETLARRIDHAKQGGEPFHLFLLGLDNFKYINDTLGHLRGDELLQQVAARLTTLSGQDGFVARFHGDSFVLIIDDLGSHELADSFSRTLNQVIAEPLRLGSLSELSITAGVGIATCPHDGDTWEELLRNAEAAMYAAKKQGGGRVQFHTPEIDSQAKQRFEMERRLYKALEHEEFILHYQPQIDVATRTIHGVEALMRWAPPGERIVPPMQFIPILEETGLIVQVGEWALRTACRQLRQWLDDGLPPLVMSINISAWQFHTGHFAESVVAVLEKYRIDPALVCLELTESIIMREVEETISTLHKLAGLGISLSIDDFGTGYSSLSYLTRMPINELKIDRSFVMKIPNDSNGTAIVDTIIGMAGHLDIATVAEGVETAEQLDYLAQQSCRRIQGYYFSKPLPEPEFRTFVANWPETSR